MSTSKCSDDTCGCVIRNNNIEDGLLEAFTRMEQRMEQMEQRMEQMEQRMEQMEQRIHQWMQRIEQMMQSTPHPLTTAPPAPMPMLDPLNVTVSTSTPPSSSQHEGL
eukprot:PhF_6_TR34415/c0_g1_i2/m.50292